MNYIIEDVTLFTGHQFLNNQYILIENGKIKKISNDNISHENTQIIRANNLILSPGFIDVHTHADLDIALTDSKNFLSQGVTTVIGGNCGISSGNINNTSLEGVLNPHKFKIPVFQNIEQYWEWVKTQRVAINYASLIGHHTLIEESKNDMNTATNLLEKYLEMGFLGISTGLVYGWGEKVNTYKDLLPLAKILSKHKAIITSHLKDQSEGLYDSVKMFTNLWDTQECDNLKIEISHLKHMIATDPKGHETLKRTLDLIDQYYQKRDVAVDVYPYTAGATSLNLKDRYKQCLHGWEDVIPFGFDKSIGEMAKEKNILPEELVTSISKENPEILAVYKNSCREEDMWEIISKPYAIIASDGLPTHPRHRGTFTKVLRYAIDNKLNLEEYLIKMTSLPAKQFGLKGLGEIKENESADLVLFDPNTVRDKATYEHPEYHSEGILKVWVNGGLAYSEGNVLDYYGKIIRRNQI